MVAALFGWVLLLPPAPGSDADWLDLARRVCACLPDGPRSSPFARVVRSREALEQEARRRVDLWTRALDERTEDAFERLGLVEWTGALDEGLDAFVATSGPLLAAGEALLVAPEADPFEARLALVAEVVRSALLEREGRDSPAPPWPDGGAALAFAEFERRVRRRAREIRGRLADRLAAGLGSAKDPEGAARRSLRALAPGGGETEFPALLRAALFDWPDSAARLHAGGAGSAGGSVLEIPAGGETLWSAALGPLYLGLLFDLVGDPARGEAVVRTLVADRADLIETGSRRFVRVVCEVSGGFERMAFDAARKVVERRPWPGPTVTQRDPDGTFALRTDETGGVVGAAARLADRVEMWIEPPVAPRFTQAGAR